MADSEKKLHGNAIEFDWPTFDALLLSDPTKVYCCEYMGVSDFYIDTRIKEKFGLSFKEYKSLRLEDTVIRIKAAMISKAASGDVNAGKYVLSNIGNWKDKQEHSFETSEDSELLKEVAELIKSKVN